MSATLLLAASCATPMQVLQDVGVVAPRVQIPPVPASGAAGSAETSGILSKQLTEFLLSQAADADEVNLAYISCRADSFNMREVLK